jgi:hypothetical protein
MASELDNAPPTQAARESATDSRDPSGDTRREALRRVGKLVAYTGPALLAMLTAADAQICSFC